MVPRAGRVEDGTTVCDTEAEELKRTMSLSLAVAPFEWKASDGETYKINLIDTPGYADFAGDVDAALSVADLAVIVSAPSTASRSAPSRRGPAAWPPASRGWCSSTRRTSSAPTSIGRWTSCGRCSAPASCPSSCRSVRRRRCTASPTCSPIRASSTSPTASTTPSPLPDDVADEEHRLHDELVEEIVSGDDEQLERYLSGDVPTAAELERTLAQELLAELEFPVLCGSALTGVGVDRLADFICELGPSPADRPTTVAAGNGDGSVTVDVGADPSGKPLAYVFKTVADQFVGQVSLFKVLSGTVVVDERLVSSARGTEERMHGLFHLRGKDHLTTDRIVAGDIGAVAKLSDTHTGTTLAPKDSPVRVAPPEPPPAVFGLALKPLTQADDDKLSAALQRLITEDPGLVVDRNEETGQTVLRGCGDTHVAVALERLARKFGVNVETEDVRVPYRETITGTAEAEGKVKKQSGGHGQYAVANLRVKPKGRGDGTEFKNSIVGGTIPKQYIPAVQRGVEETMATGGVHGFPVVDVLRGVLRRQVPLRRLLRHGVPFGGRPRPQRSAGQGRLGGAGADLAAHGPGARGPPGRRARRPQLAARAGQRHQLDRRRAARDRRPRAGGRDPALRRRAALDDRRAGDVLRRPRPLRHPPEPPRVEDQDGRDHRRALTAARVHVPGTDRGNMPAVPTEATMLAPYRVLDLTDGRAELATFILAGLGADVIKVEPPGGAASRHEGHVVDGEPAALASLRFHAFNRGKRSVVLDLDDATGRRLPRPRRHRRLRVRERRRPA